jgi:hypothetical protein
MLNLTNSIPQDDGGQPLPIRRTPTAGNIIATATSRRLIGTKTHWWGGRTTPCDDPTCEACAAGCPYRWHAYVSAYDHGKQLHFLFECTAAAADAFEKYASDHESLRGCTFRASRNSKRQNARVQIETHPYTGKPSDLPAEPDLVACLSRLWNIPTTQIVTPDVLTTQNRITILNSQIEAQRHAAATKKNGETR